VRDLGGFGDRQSDKNRSSNGLQQMTNAPVLEAKNIVKELGKGAGKVMALRGVSLVLVPGELTLLMGPSGSGKTTLLSILGCILSPTSGEIRIAGRATGGLSPEELAELRRKHIGFIFQSYNLFPTLNAVENVRIALDVLGQKGYPAAARAEEVLREVGLGHRLQNYPSNLSGGEQQRVAVARAIAASPSIVLADEPTAALDSENGHAVMALLARIAKDQNRSVLAVTHDPRTLGYADRVIRIEDGKIVGEERRPEGVNSPEITDLTKKRRKANA
jgi:putative ABC transport system ATP-binding protein